MLKWINRTIYLKLENELASIYKSIGIYYVVSNGMEPGDRGERRMQLKQIHGALKKSHLVCNSAAFIFAPFEIRNVFKVF